MLLETMPGRIEALIRGRYQQLGPISYFTFTIRDGHIQLNVYGSNPEPWFVSYSNQRFNRMCLRLVRAFAEQCGKEWPASPTFILLDQLRRFYHFNFAAWPDVRHPDYPTQRLICAESVGATRRAFRTARPELSESVLAAALALAPASQHRLMDRLLLKHPNGGFDTPREALRQAREHEAQLPK